MSELSRERTQRIAIRRPVTMAMLFISLFVFGWKSYQELPLNLMPDLSYPTLTVRTEYESAAPEDVEELVTRPLEEALSLVSGMVEVSSISSPGLSEVILEFTWGTNMDEALQGVRESLDLVTLPLGVTKKPIILRFDPTLDPVFRVAIRGRDLSDIGDEAERRRIARHDLTAIREDAERFVKSDLEAQGGIAQVLVRGGREQEVRILVQSERLKNLGLSLQYITDSLNQQNINLSGGSLKEGKTEFLVRTLNEFQSVDEIKEMVLTTPGGQQLRLRDVATVEMGEKDRETIVRLDGQEAVALDVYKEGDYNTVQVCNRLKIFFGLERKVTLTERLLRYLETKAEEMRQRRAEQLGEAAGPPLLRLTDRGEAPVASRVPPYAEIFLISDQSRFIVSAIGEVKRTAIIGGVLALIVLFFFLRELKATFIVGIAIPISIVATFVPMFMRDISLNMMSLGGLALGVGMLVDNSIVVLESISRCKEEGDDIVEAADRGTREVSGAVTASTLTTIAVFFPIVFVEGVAGQVFGDLALTVTFSLLASLLVALYLIPMVASRTRPEFLTGGNAVWLVRAFRESRDAGAPGWLWRAVRMGSLSVLYSGEWLAEAWGESVGALFSSLWSRDVTGDASPRAPRAAVAESMSRLAAVLLCPLVLALFLLQTSLKIVVTFFTSFLFIVGLWFAGIVWIFVRLSVVILWAPLKIFDTVFYGIRNFYVILLQQSLRFSPVILLIVAGVAVHSGFIATRLGRELIPPLKQGEFGIRMEAPPGTRLENTALQGRQIEALAMAMQDIESVTVEVGSERIKTRNRRGENVAEFTVRLRDPDENAQHQDVIMEELRQKIALVTSNKVAFTLPRLFSFKTAVELQIRGEELPILRTLGNQALKMVKSVDGVKDAELSLQEGYPEITVVFDTELLASKNLSPSQVAQRVRSEVQGNVATQFSRGAEKIDIRVLTDRTLMSSVNDLRALSVTDGYPPVPLDAVATIEVKDGPSEIRRIDQRKVVVVTANVVGRDLGAVSRDILSLVDGLELPSDYDVVLAGQNRELETSYSGLQFALLLAIFLVYVVMASQFESIWHPALIMFSVPLAFIGVVYTLDWYAINLSIVVFMGGIVLAGIVVNDAIVLVDYINQLRRRGMSKRDAIISAGTVRFRPIIMTTLTTVLGLLPMVLWTGAGAEMRQPMAITVIAGLSSATVLTLLIIPMIYDFVGVREKV